MDELISSRILIIGASGQLGSELASALAGQGELFTPAHVELDITNPTVVETYLASVRPTIVINCAAFHQVDACERDMARARAVNKAGARNVAMGCRKIDAYCVYISTDYVFDGQKPTPYDETDRPRPINAYGRTKYAGEITVQQYAPQALVVRIATLFGKKGSRSKGGNFVDRMLAGARLGETLTVFDDLRMSPTYAVDAAAVIATLIAKRATGVYHVTNTGSCSLHEFATEILDQAGVEARLVAVGASSREGAAPRPANSSLVSVRLAELGIPSPRPWQEALRAYLDAKEQPVAAWKKWWA